MKQINKTLYGLNKDGSLKIWEVFSDEQGQVIVKYGKLGGKIQTKITQSEGKNAGKANETSAAEQAVKEALAKYVLQQKKGYFETKEQALAYVSPKPMLAQNYKDQAHKVAYPCYLQPKLNGLRCATDEGHQMRSKSGESYNHFCPSGWIKDIEGLQIPVDGEIFAGHQKDGGLSLQKIKSAWSKHNENTCKLKYYVYDIPVKNTPWKKRLELLEQFSYTVDSDIFEVVKGKWCYSEAEADAYYEEQLALGAEGVVYRNAEGLYEHGVRSYDLIKRKPRLDAEAKVISSLQDKNGWGVLTCALQDGKTFECQMRVDSDEKINYRLYDNSLKLVNSFITFEYEEFSDEGVPTKPVGVAVRVLNEDWDPLE